MRAVLLLTVLLAACAPSRTKPPEKIVLWAWDRAEDLRFLKPGEAEVAAHMATFYLRNGKVETRRRILPLQLPPDLAPIQVVRFESDGSPLPRPEQVAAQFYLELSRPGLPIQLDFDARASQTAWYREFLLLTKLWNRRVSMTSIASACIDDPWFSGLTEEVVPMLFRMGPRAGDYFAILRRRGGFAEGCREAIGIATDEPVPWRPAIGRVYVFSPAPWTRKSFDQARLLLR